MRYIVLFFAFLCVSCCPITREATDVLWDDWKTLRVAAEKGIQLDPDLDAETKAARMGLIQAYTDLLKEVRDVANN